MKDLFSSQSAAYAAFRPQYPQALYDFLYEHTPDLEKAWDCATGNGQVALALADRFQMVVATDASEAQLAHAPAMPNIIYGRSMAEQTAFRDDLFSLITVAQAVHWFKRDAFWREARRILKPHGVIAVWGYGSLQVDPEFDRVFHHEFYRGILDAYWEPKRKLVDEAYKTIAFPFIEIKAPAFEIRVQWTLEHLAGYLETWSSVQTYKRKHKRSPVPEFIERIRPLWPDSAPVDVVFPLFMRVGKKMW